MVTKQRGWASAPALRTRPVQHCNIKRFWGENGRQERRRVVRFEGIGLPLSFAIDAIDKDDFTPRHAHIPPVWQREAS